MADLVDKPILPDPDIYHPVEEYPIDDWRSETTSIASSLYRGLMENGRRYQTLKSSDSFVPSDEQQFDAYEAGHVTAMLMESDRPNPLFRAPVTDPQHILDVGTGQGSWAIDVADMFPEAIVRGVDLFPPPVSWLPPNCILEVDDVLQEWTWQEPFDLVHLRILDAAFNHKEQEKLYENCFQNIRPGGYIEQLELTPDFVADDGSLPPDTLLADWGNTVVKAAENSGKPLDLYYRCAELMTKAGFVDIKVYEHKWPLGPWPKDKQLKEAGIVNNQHWATGMDGYAMYLLTKYGEPSPWSKEEVQVYVAKLRRELVNPRFHIHHKAKRVWARKPLPEEQAPPKPAPAVKQEPQSPQVKQERDD